MIEFISQNWRNVVGLLVVFGSGGLAAFVAAWTLWVQPGEAERERLIIERDNARRGLAEAAAQVIAGGFERDTLRP